MTQRHKDWVSVVGLFVTIALIIGGWIWAQSRTSAQATEALEEANQNTSRYYELAQKFEIMQNDVTYIKSDIQGLSQNVDTLTEDVIILKQDVNVLKQDVNVLKQDVNILKQDVGIIKGDVAYIKRVLDEHY